MSIKKETRTQPAKEYDATVSITCDLCKKEFTGASDWSDEIKWSGDRHDESITAVRFKEGYGYPDGGHYDVREYHVCPECFTGKLEPWLKIQGAEPTSREIDF